MIKSGSRFSDGKPDVDKAKRIYRAAVETVRRLDNIPHQKKAYRDVFRQDAVGLRTRLKEYCERLMFYDPALYGRKAEEVLWRKVFYDIIQLVKHNRRHIHPHSSVENAFRTHLAAATGYYYHLLFRLQQEFNLHFDGILDFYLLSPSTPGNKYQNHRRKEGDKAIKEWATKACHRCLVYLGDIARYQQAFDEGFSSVTAERYYYQALALFPEIGMPHNQLGTMSGSRHYSCDAAYHYIRCLVSELSFEGATGNLDRLFEKISKRFHDLTVTTPRDQPPHQQRQRDVRRFLVRFMYLLNIFFKSPESIGNYEIQEQCQLTLQDFDLCMFYEMSGDSEDGTEHKPTYLDDDIIFKIVIMCMASIYYQQKNGSRQVAASIAFLLALVSHVLNHVICRLQRALQEAENPVQLPQVDAEEFQLGSGHMKSWSEDSSTQNGLEERSGENLTDPSKQQQKKRKMNRLRSLRRRRHRDDSDSSEGSCDNSLDDSDLSEGEGGEGSDDGLSLSDDSDDFIDCLAQDSDSDFEENLNKLDRKSTELNGLSPSKSNSTTDSLRSSSHDSLANENTDSGSSVGGASDLSAAGEEPTNMSNIWNKQGVDDSLILLSSELFTNASSNPILGQNHRNVPSFSDINTHPPAIDGISRVTNTHKRNDSADLAQKLASFVIETDTETVMPTDAEMSPVQSDSDVENPDDENRDQETDKQQQLAMLLDVVQSEKLLAVVKVACDWMKCHSHVITTCAQSSQSLWSRLAVLLNFLPNKDQIMQVCPPQVSPNLKAVLGASGENRWQQCFPLVEDITLQCFVPLQEIHATIDFSLWSQAVVKDDVENLLRVACLRQFGHYLSSLTGVEFFYQPLEKEFLGPAQTHRSPAEKVQQDKLVTVETRRNQLMRDMAQLRLQAEVTELEGSLQSVDTPSFPPYLLSDTQLLCDNLAMFKHLTQTARCIIIIPLSVIDTLDLMKKESSAARETIRWLEVELRKGNRYIRAQKAKERAGPTSKRNLKKENRDVWCVQELLACGLYLSQQTDQLVNHSMVTILTTHDLQSLENMAKLKALLRTCKQQGICIEKMEDFKKKWKHLWEGKG